MELAFSVLVVGRYTSRALEGKWVSLVVTGSIHLGRAG